MGDGHEEHPGYDPTETEEEIRREEELHATREAERMRILEDAGPIGLEDRQDFIARPDLRRRHPDLRFPTPGEVLGSICPVCQGTTWVIRANAELNAARGEAIMVELVPCDNPNCAQLIKLGLRPIMHLALPNNEFNLVVPRPHSKIVMALVVIDDK